jgi:glycyl-tRNA synthetase
MAFIVKKEINGKEYYYLNENKRIQGKVKTKTLAYLGKTKKEAEKKAAEIIKNIKKEETLEKKEKMEEKKETKKEELKISSRISIESKQDLIENKITIEDIANFCKAKGFIFRSSDIYGGLSGFWDFGPLGVELLNNIKKEWWNFFVYEKENIVGMEASIISHPRTWKASGHIANFNDVAVRCKKCKKSTKIDKSEVGKVKCECGGEYEILGEFSLMFKTKVGALNAEDAYLRGETAQGMFLDFKLIQQTSRMNLPFGIAQIGRCFRNEIAPRDFLFRSREFHIGEFEFFINPEEKKCELLDNTHLEVEFDFLDSETQKEGKDSLRKAKMKELIEKKKLEEWHAYWLSEQIIWFKKMGLNEIKIREHTKEELSHYSSATFDIDYLYPFGSREVAGNANRGQYDLTQHQKESKVSMEVFDEKYKNKIIPKVIEPTFGIERIFLALLTKAYTYDKERENVVLKLPPKIAPVKASIFPIVKRDDFEKICLDIFHDLKKEWNVNYDISGSIGRRYSRNDEIGTPYCITIDEDSLKNKDVTFRDRDTKKQIRVKIDSVKETLKKLINKEIEFEKAGKLIS